MPRSLSPRWFPSSSGINFQSFASRNNSFGIFSILCFLVSVQSALVPHLPRIHDVPSQRMLHSNALYSSMEEDQARLSGMGDSPSVDELKAKLARLCTNEERIPTASHVSDLVFLLEKTASDEGVGQDSHETGLLSGDWELIYSSEDATRSSPFFWAFRKAFPRNADQIFYITDNIPAPLKEIGEAYQSINLNTSTSTGRFVSRVKVATLGGAATSIMTTKADIVGIEGTNGMRLKIGTTKPEESTFLQKCFGALGSVINENAPAFPSGEALEQVQAGSSEVTILTSFCDEGLRISRNPERSGELFVWRRREFASFDYL